MSASGAANIGAPFKAGGALLASCRLRLRHTAGNGCLLPSRRHGHTAGPIATGPPMAINATIMNAATGRPIQKMTFGRMPKPWASFTLETGEMVTAERIDVNKAPPGKFGATIDIWVTPKSS
jgi:hypothetical protein